jgi:hypothetical protein
MVQIAEVWLQIDERGIVGDQPVQKFKELSRDHSDGVDFPAVFLLIITSDHLDDSGDNVRVHLVFAILFRL